MLASVRSTRSLLAISKLKFTIVKDNRGTAGLPLLELPAVAQHRLVRNLLLVGLGLLLGLLALAIAVPIEPQLSSAVIALFSPGLKLAELIMPETHKSMAWTFGWFLRIAIAANAVFYYAICALLAHFLLRRAPK